MANQTHVKSDATNLAGYFYSDPAVYEKERAKIFRQSWQLLGAAAAVAEPGAYIASRFAGFGVFVQRGKDGVLRGFQNICAHRGARMLAEGQGSCEVLRCPYHGWIYDDSGQLADTPWFGEPSPFDMAELKLAEISVELWRGLVFVAIAPSVGLSEQLGDLPSEAAIFPMESYVPAVKRRFIAKVNWKAYLDQFNEFYHVPTVHPPDKAVGIRDYQAIPLKGIMRMVSPQGAASDAAYYGGKWLWGWPNWTVSFFPGGMKTSWINPVAVRETVVDFEYFFSDTSAAGEAFRTQVAGATDSIFAEDVAAAGLAQLSYDSGDYRPGPYHPRLEQAVAYFHDRVREALGEA